jgi:hypothetical protein
MADMKILARIAKGGNMAERPVFGGAKFFRLEPEMVFS